MTQSNKPNQTPHGRLRLKTIPEGEFIPTDVIDALPEAEYQARVDEFRAHVREVMMRSVAPEISAEVARLIMAAGFPTAPGVH